MARLSRLLAIVLTLYFTILAYLVRPEQLCGP